MPEAAVVTATGQAEKALGSPVPAVLSVEIIMSLANCRRPASGAWRDLVDGLTDDCRSRLDGELQGMFPHLLDGMRRPGGWNTRSALIELEYELECWACDIHAPLDYLALVLSGSKDNDEHVFWTRQMAEITQHESAPFGVRVLRLVTLSLTAAVESLEEGFIRLVEKRKSDIKWVCGVVSRIAQLESWLGFKFGDHLSPRAGAALALLHEANDLQFRFDLAMKPFEGILPQDLIREIRTKVCDFIRRPRDPSLITEPHHRVESMRLDWVKGHAIRHAGDGHDNWMVIHARPTRGR
jgi:hypothetical protein